MKVLKKQGLFMMLLAALVVTLVLGVVFALPARTVADAEEIVYEKTVRVSTEQALKDAVAQAGETPTQIILENNIEMNSISSGTKDFQRWYDITVNRKQVIELDLAGHILSAAPMSHGTKPVIYNYGTLSIVDSSGDYSGAVVSNGYIHLVGEKYDWDSSRTVIENHGGLTVDANIRINCPRPTAEGTNGYFTTFGSAGDNIDGSNISDVYLIYNVFVAPTSDDEKDDKWKELIYPTSLTINGGTFDLTFSKQIKNNLPPMEHFFLIRDTDLTVNGGTFRNSGQRKPWYVGGFLADIQTVSGIYYEYSYGKYASYFKDIYHVDVKITGGDFSDKYLLGGDSDTIGLIYTGDYIVQDGKEADEYEVSISGGTFPMDFSAYTDAEHMMKENDDGTYGVVIVDDDYIKEFAVAKLMLDGDEPTVSGYYGSFEGAWNAAKTRAAMGQNVTIQLLKNAESKILYLNGVKKDVSITIDLNGKELKISVEGQNAAADNAFICADNSTSEPGITTLTVCDKTEGQTGAINFVYPEKYSKYGSIYITEHMRFVLESGTLKRTGGGFNWGQNSSSEHRKSIFYLKDGAYNVNAVTIKGGNILSNLSSGDQGHLIARASDGNGDPSYWTSLERYTKDLTLDLADYLPEEEVGKGCQFSWDVSSILSEGFKCAEDTNTHTFYVSRIGTEKYLVGIQSFGALSAAIDAAKADSGKTILMVAPDTLTEAVVLDGVTLDLNVYQHFTLVAPTVTLTGGALVKNGAIQGNVVVEGPAAFESFTLQGALTVKNGAKLAITEGTYDGAVTVEEGADLTISGGSFRGSEVKTIETYLPQYYGAFKTAAETYADETLYPVRIAPNTTVQAWYADFIKNADEDGAYLIHTAADWNNFALYVSSGADVFSGKMIKLAENIDFSKQAATARLAASENEVNFLPAGTNASRFAGSFDGQGNTMSGIYAQEINVGLFGATAYGAYVRVMNVKIENSTFLIGNGILDPMNANATPAGGAVIGEGHLDAGRGEDQWSGGITLSGVTVGHVAEAGQFFVGGVVGHSWGSVCLDVLRIEKKTTIQPSWKAGGVVGYLEGEFYVKKADIEQGTQEDGSDNGLILTRGLYTGALIGHANGSKNTIEDCKILEHDDSLIGSTYAGGVNSVITIKGSETELDVYRVVGEGRAPGAKTEIELSQEVTEDGIKNSSVKLQETENGMKFYEASEDGTRKEIEIEPDADGNYEAVSKIDVTIANLTGAASYNAQNVLTFEVTDFVLITKDGTILASKDVKVQLTVTVELSKYGVGKQVALITSYTAAGDGASSFNFLPVGNQTFVEVTVQAAMLTVSVNANGEVVYDGFVGGEDESVLGGTLTLTKVDNGDGTYTVTPSGLESENYNIVYTSSIVSADVFETNSNALWIALAVVGSVLAVCGAAAIVFAVRRKRAE